MTKKKRESETVSDASLLQIQCEQLPQTPVAKITSDHEPKINPLFLKLFFFSKHFGLSTKQVPIAVRVEVLGSKLLLKLLSLAPR